MSFSSDLDRLEKSGQWSQAFTMLRRQLSLGIAVDADHLHSMGRPGNLGELKSVNGPIWLLYVDPDRALTCNNLNAAGPPSSSACQG